MDDWNPDEWQGKRRDQVESSMGVFGYCSIGLLISFVAVLAAWGVQSLF